MSKIIFFIRAEPDLDHFSPTIFALLRHNRIDIDVFIIDPFKTYTDDYRIKILKEGYNCNLTHIQSMFPRWAQFIYSLIRNSFTLLNKWLLHHPPKLIKAVLLFLLVRLRHVPAKFVMMFFPWTKFETIFADNPRGVVVFDHSSSSLALKVSHLARRYGYKLVSLPHSLQDTQDVTANFQNNMKAYNDIYDVVVVPNHIIAKRCIAQGVDTERITVLGSARFCQEWIDCITQPFFSYLLPESLPIQKKILVITTPKLLPFNWVEVLQAIEYLAQQNDLYVVIQLHPRFQYAGLPGLSKHKNLHYEFANPNIPTTAWIEWADIVVFWETSVIYHALRRRKPIIFLKYLTERTYDFQDTIYGWQVNNFQEFQTVLNHCLVDATYCPYAPTEAENCLKKYVDAGIEDVLDGYTTFLGRLARA